MSRDKEPEKNPSTTSIAYDLMSPKWRKIEAVLGGTDTMRASPDLLPQHQEESDTAYLERLMRNVLFNMTAITLNSWVGRPFSEQVVLNEDVPEVIEEFAENIDLLGHDINVFAREWFKDGMAKAFSHVLVEMPRPRDTEAEEGRERTLQDDREENLRPYWVHFKPEQVIFSHAEIVDGNEKLTEIRILMENIQQVGFAEVVVSQIRRVYLANVDTGAGVIEERMIVELYELKQAKDRRRKPEWVLVESFITDINFIPLVTFYSDREAFMLGKPPVEDLANLNVAWWQSSSDQRAVLTVARFPMLALSGGTDENNQLRVGPHEWLYSPDAKSKFYYVEHTGAAIEAGREDLHDLEGQMMSYGAEFMKKQAGGQTATARALDSAEATSPLQDATQRFIDAMNTALEYTAILAGLDEGGTVTISTDFGPDEIDSEEMSTLRETRKMRDISRQTYLTELNRRGLFSEEFDVKGESALLENESLLLEGGGLGDVTDEPDESGETEEEKEAREKAEKEAEGSQDE